MIGAILFILAVVLYFNPAKRYLAVFLLFVIATAGFQLVPVNWMVLPPVGVNKPYDWLLIFCATVFILSPRIFIHEIAWKNYRNITLFGLVLTALLCYSIFYREVEVSISIRVYRNFCFFLLLFVFIQVPFADLQKIFKLIIYATTIASAMYCCQVFLGRTLLNTVGSDLVTTNDEGSMMRYYNLPVFLFPVVFFFFFSRETFQLSLRNIVMAVNMLAIILSQHRNLMLAIAVCYLLHLYLSKKLKTAKLFLYIFIGLMVFNIGNSLLNNRFSDGFKDLSGASMNVSPVTLNALSANELSTTEFRWYLFAERFQYVSLHPLTTLFGIGFLTEDSKLTRLLRFNIGLPDESNGVFQVDTGDIIWSVMILQFGIAGIIFFIIYYFSFLRKFLRYRENPIAQIGILLIVVLFITSFYGTAILQPYTTCMLMLLVAYTFLLNMDNNKVKKSLQTVHAKFLPV